MNLVLATISIFLLIVLGIIIFQLKNIVNQLDYINKEDKTNKLITTGLQGLYINTLAAGINKLISRHREKEIDLEYEKSKIKAQITSISHDLRTPLTSIIGYTDLLERTKDQEDFKSYIKIIKKKSEDLQKLVEDFYEVTLIEDTNYSLDLEKMSPGYILEDRVMDYYHDLENENIKLDLEIHDYSEVDLNFSALSRVYQNLIGNIKTHGKDQAYIFHGRKDGQLVTIIKNKIKETEDFREEKLFEKFYTGEKSRHSKKSGVGMYSSKILLGKMGHKVSAKVEDGFLSILIVYKEG